MAASSTPTTWSSLLAQYSDINSFFTGLDDGSLYLLNNDGKWVPKYQLSQWDMTVKVPSLISGKPMEEAFGFRFAIHHPYRSLPKQPHPATWMTAAIMEKLMAKSAEDLKTLGVIEMSNRGDKGWHSCVTSVKRTISNSDTTIDAPFQTYAVAENLVPTHDALIASLTDDIKKMYKVTGRMATRIAVTRLAFDYAKGQKGDNVFVHATAALEDFATPENFHNAVRLLTSIFDEATMKKISGLSTIQFGGGSIGSITTVTDAGEVVHALPLSEPIDPNTVTSYTIKVTFSGSNVIGKKEGSMLSLRRLPVVKIRYGSMNEDVDIYTLVENLIRESGDNETKMNVQVTGQGYIDLYAWKWTHFPMGDSKTNCTVRSGLSIGIFNVMAPATWVEPVMQVKAEVAPTTKEDANLIYSDMASGF